MKMCISNKKTNTCDKHYYQRYNNQRRNIIIKDTTIKEDIDEKDDKPQQCSKQQNHLAKQLPRKLSSPRQDGISQHHRLFKMCISCNADHRPTISFAPPHPLKVGITAQIVHVNLKESTKLISCS